MWTQPYACPDQAVILFAAWLYFIYPGLYAKLALQEISMLKVKHLLQILLINFCTFAFATTQPSRIHLQGLTINVNNHTAQPIKLMTDRLFNTRLNYACATNSPTLPSNTSRTCKNTLRGGLWICPANQLFCSVSHNTMRAIFRNGYMFFNRASTCHGMPLQYPGGVCQAHDFNIHYQFDQATNTLNLSIQTPKLS